MWTCNSATNSSEEVSSRGTSILKRLSQGMIAIMADTWWFLQHALDEEERQERASCGRCVTLGTWVIRASASCTSHIPVLRTPLPLCHISGRISRHSELVWPPRDLLRNQRKWKERFKISNALLPVGLLFNGCNFKMKIKGLFPSKWQALGKLLRWKT